jgi:polyhydroxybutyrate depolymerase
MQHRVQNWAERIISILGFAIVAIVPASCSLQVRQPAPTVSDLGALGLQEHSLRIGKIDRWFLVQPPADPLRPAPVLLVLHGGTQSMRRLFAPNAGATRGWPELMRRKNALLLVPNAINPDNGDPHSDNQNWNDLREDVASISAADDVGFVLSLLNWAHSHYHTDRSRVYVTGASNGGMMTFRLLIEAPERFAAGAVFVSALPSEDIRLKRPSKPTPLLIANGTLDSLVLWNGGKIAGNRGETRSVAATVNWWVGSNKAIAQASNPVRLNDRDPSDNCTIERSVHAARFGGAPVVTYTMKGGGHNIPSSKYSIPETWLVRRFLGPVCRDIEGIELAWDFLSAYRR